MKLGEACEVDRAAPDLARLCAGWAVRGRSLAELVGLVPVCACMPMVMPRVEIAARLTPGPLLDALRATRAIPGRLAVVEARSNPRSTRGPEYREHHIHVPAVDAEDTRGLLEPLAAKRRELVYRRMAEGRRHPSWSFIRDLIDNDTPDALYLEAKFLDLGAALQVRKRTNASAEARQLLEAAAYEVHPGQVACLVYPDSQWERMAVTWIELEQLGLLPGENPCHPTTILRLHAVHSEGLRTGVYG